MWIGLDLLEDDEWFNLFRTELMEMTKVIEKENPLIPPDYKVKIEWTC